MSRPEMVARAEVLWGSVAKRDLDKAVEYFAPLSRADIDKTLKALQSRVHPSDTPAVIARIEVREISPEQARAEIIDYVQRHPGVDPYDIALALKLDGWFVADIVDDLIDAGEFVETHDTEDNVT